MTETDSQPIAENEQVKELLHMKGGIDRSERPKTGDLFYRYETEVISGKGTVTPPESSVS